MHLHVSGLRAHGRARAERRAARGASSRAREGARISVDLASWSAIRDSGVDAFREAPRALAPDVVFANEDEERVVGRLARDALDPQARRARAARSTGTSARRFPSSGSLDSTGAGDALAAGWIVGGPDLALDAAARCVQQLGAMPVASPA